MRDKTEVSFRWKNRGALRMRGALACGLVLILGRATSAESESPTATKVRQKQTAGTKHKAEETKGGKNDLKTYVLVGAGEAATV